MVMGHEYEDQGSDYEEEPQKEDDIKN